MRKVKKAALGDNQTKSHDSEVTACQTLLVCLHVHAQFNVCHVFSVTFIFKLKMDKEEDLQRLDVTTQNALGYGVPQETGFCPILSKLRRSDLNCCVFILTLFLQVLQLHMFMS